MKDVLARMNLHNDSCHQSYAGIRFTKRLTFMSLIKAMVRLREFSVSIAKFFEYRNRQYKMYNYWILTVKDPWFCDVAASLKVARSRPSFLNVYFSAKLFMWEQWRTWKVFSTCRRWALVGKKHIAFIPWHKIGSMLVHYELHAQRRILVWFWVHLQEFINMTNEKIENVVKTNLLGCLLCTKAAWKLMSQQEGGGHIFNMDGAGADGSATPQYAAYGATKAGKDIIE